MSELARIDEREATLNPFGSQAAFESSQRMAKALSSSSLIPKEYQGNLPNTMIALELAARTGSSPFIVMQNLDIIHGRPSWRATYLIGTVNSCGRFSPLRFVKDGTPGTDSFGCRAVAKDKDTGEELVGALITIGMAKAEGWFSKNGSKWKTMPEQMLMYRAASFWTRIYAPEISLGMQTAEEAQELAPLRVDAQVVASAPSMTLEAALLAEAAPTPPKSEPKAIVAEEPPHDGDGVLSDEEQAARIDRGEA